MTCSANAAIVSSAAKNRSNIHLISLLCSPTRSINGLSGNEISVAGSTDRSSSHLDSAACELCRN
jgi:hypothetical protein